MHLILHLALLSFACKDPEVINQCNDTFALNFNESANDNINCIYEEIDFSLKLIANLAKDIKETSGLAKINDILITHNDRGNTNELFFLDPSDGNVLRTVSLSNVQNIDWEDLAQDDDFLYIGDMGNNDGDRRNLAIYKIQKNKLSVPSVVSATVDEVIRFNYPEQTSFQKNSNHNFDCEAIIIKENHIYLFTKHRADDNSTLYRIPKVGGDYEAELISTFNTQGMITGADINNQGEIALIGLDKKDQCFVWLLDNYENDDFFSGTKQKVNLGSYAEVGQMESILFSNGNELYITAEKVKKYNLKPSLFLLNINR